MRTTLVLLPVFCCLTIMARAQTLLDVGAPESAFAGGPIRLSKNAAAQLRAHYQGDKVPLVPQPYRGRLDTALLGRDWARVEATKKELVAADGIAMALAWEQTRFIATGAIGVAEMHALDVAATGSTGLSETAVMLWFYAVAVTMTDGHKCADESAKEAHLDRLRGPVFEPVLRIVRVIGDDRLAAMRDLAMRLETVLAADRTDDTMCRVGSGKADIKPDSVWRPEAALTRAILPRHLVALGTLMRPRRMASPDGVKPELARSKLVTPDPARTDARMSEPVVGASPRDQSGPAKPEVSTPGWVGPKASNSERGPDRPEPSPPDPATLAKPGTEPSGTAAAISGPAQPDVVRQRAGRSDPTRFEPPNLELAIPGQPARH